MKKNILCSVFVLLSLLIMVSCCKNSTAEKTTLYLAEYGNKGHPAIREFNESQDSYVIEVIDYSNNGSIDRETAITRLNAELASGDAPDIFDLYSFHLDAQAYATMGCLQDLYPYLYNDAELKNNEFVDSVFHACEINGSLYTAVSSFSVITVLGSKEALGSGEHWNFSRLKQLAQDAGGAGELFTSNYNKNGFLSAALSLSTKDYIDFENDRVKFNSEEYKTLLDFCNLFPTIADDAPQKNPILAYYCIGSFMELQYYEAIFGGEVINLGFPTSNGNGSCFANMMDQFAMNAGSRNKDAVWNFLRVFFTEEYQCKQYVDFGYTQFPTNKLALERLIQKSLSTIYIDSDGEDKVELTQRGDQDGFEYHAASQEQIDQMMEIIENTEDIYYALLQVQELALQEADAFFAGDKSVDEVAEITQNVISTYWAEQHG